LLQRSTIQLLRFHFSFFLMPLYWFSLSFLESIDVPRAALVFVILHLLVYPASNGYNSYIDRDEGSIGGLEHPLQPTRQLFIATIIMDVLAVALSFLISGTFATCVCIYVIFSKLYSSRLIRLKQYPITSFLIVMLIQGSLTFFMIYHGSHASLDTHMSWLPLIAAGFLVGSFYPISQIYQHEADRADNIKTMSMLLGKKNTFIFCVLMYCFATFILATYYSGHDFNQQSIILIIFSIPVIVYLINWFSQVAKNEAVADFKHTMKMNWLASTCSSLAFITIILFKRFG
jgi:1,4-dihydroxy-2-naphthoate octaprenyltransferase